MENGVRVSDDFFEPNIDWYAFYLLLRIFDGGDIWTEFGIFCGGAWFGGFVERNPFVNLNKSFYGWPKNESFWFFILVIIGFFFFDYDLFLSIGLFLLLWKISNI